MNFKFDMIIGSLFSLSCVCGNLHDIIPSYREDKSPNLWLNIKQVFPIEYSSGRKESKFAVTKSNLICVNVGVDESIWDGTFTRDIKNGVSIKLLNGMRKKFYDNKWSSINFKKHINEFDPNNFIADPENNIESCKNENVLHIVVHYTINYDKKPLLIQIKLSDSKTVYRTEFWRDIMLDQRMGILPIPRGYNFTTNSIYQDLGERGEYIVQNYITYIGN